MRVAILQSTGYLDKQIKRLLQQHGINGDIVTTINRSVVQDHDSLVITFEHEIPNMPVVIERIIMEQTIHVIYVDRTLPVSRLFNVVNDMHFHYIDVATMEVGLPVLLETMQKFTPKVRRLQTDLNQTKEQLDLLQKTNKAKRLLMKKGLSEDESHQFIQRQSMDMRISKKELVNLIIENKIDI